MNRTMIAGSVRASAVKGIVTVRAFTYDTVDMYRTSFRPGCATKSLNARMPTLNASHSWDLRDVIGRAISWKDTPVGPEVTFRIDDHPDVPLARQVLAQIQSQTLTEASIGFSRVPGGDRSATNDDRKRWPGVERVHTEIEIQEISIVPMAAVDGAEVLSLRARRLDSVLASIRGGRAPSHPRLAAADAEIDEALDVAVRSGLIGARRVHEARKGSRR